MMFIFFSNQTEAMGINRIIPKLIAFVLAAILAVVFLHVLPNALAAFIYGTHQAGITKRFLSDEQP